jgi:hypothetical protein
MNDRAFTRGKRQPESVFPLQLPGHVDQEPGRRAKPTRRETPRPSFSASPLGRAVGKVKSALAGAAWVVFLLLAGVGTWGVGCKRVIDPSGSDQIVTVAMRYKGAVIGRRLTTQRESVREGGLLLSLLGVVLFVGGLGNLQRR